MRNYSLINSLDFSLNVESEYIYDFYRNDERILDDNIISQNDPDAILGSYINIGIQFESSYDTRIHNYKDFVSGVLTNIETLSNKTLNEEELNLFSKSFSNDDALVTINSDIMSEEIDFINNHYNINTTNLQDALSFIKNNKKIEVNKNKYDSFVKSNRDNIFFTKNIINSMEKFSEIFQNNKNDISNKKSIKLFENFTPLSTNSITQYFQLTNSYYYMSVGFLVEKYIIEEDNEERDFTKKDTRFFKINDDDLRIESDTSLTINSNLNIRDNSVKYGSEYFYIIYPVYVATIPKKNDYYLCESYLFCDSPYFTKNIKCEELKRPDSPTNLFFRYYESEKCLEVSWAKPQEEQRDVKGYQIFKRKSLFEPYSLIGQIEFFENNDFYIRNSQISQNIIEKSAYNKTYFKDKDFNINEVQLYTICALDARGYSSNYSEQIAVYYDFYTKKVQMDLVSADGAPLHMPNLLIPRKTRFFENEENLISNLPYEENVSKISLYVTPEYKKIKLEGESHEDILSSNYKFSIFKLESNELLIKDINLNI